MAPTLALVSGIDGEPGIDGAALLHQPEHAPDARSAGWLTATVRPAGMFGHADAGRLRALLDALTGCASLVVLDLQAAQLCSVYAAIAVDEAAAELERSGGCLICVNADPTSLAHLAAAGPHAVLVRG